MKGILYGNFLLNRKWFIAAGIAGVLGTAVCALLADIMRGDPSDITPFVLFVMQMVVVAIAVEWLARNLEANIKCRFTDMTLAGGLTKNTFVLSELLKNLIAIGAAFVFCVIMQLAMCIFDRSYLNWDSIKLIAGLTLLMGAVEWSVNPLVIVMKSAEKAGLTMGLLLGFGIVLPIMTLAYIFDEESQAMLGSLIKLLNGKWSLLVVTGISIVVYAVFYIVFLSRVKKGDVC